MKDFFIIYNNADSEWAKWIAWQLEEVGYSTIVQAWDFRPGSNFVLEMDRATQEAQRTIAILSPDYLDTGFAQAVWAVAFQRDPTGKLLAFVPLRVKPCDLTGLLSSLVSIDLVGLDQIKAREALLQGIQSDRLKPQAAPAFPGSPTPPPFPGVEAQTGSPTNANSRKTPFSYQPEPLELKMPEMGESFLKRNRHDREYLINIADTIISPISSVDGIKDLLRGKLPDQQINRINFRDGSRNIAESIIGNLERRGVLNPPLHHYHALGAFLNDLIEDETVSYDAAVKLVALLFAYTLLNDRSQIEKLSAQYQVPSPHLAEELLISHPFSFTSLPGNINTTNLQEHFESLYNRRRYLLDVNFLSQGAKVARSVCRIDFDKRGEGTGFLVTPNFILTNYHVMIPPGYRGDPNARASKCEIKFEFSEGEHRGVLRTLHDQWLVEKSEPTDLDFMLLRLNKPVTADSHISPLTLEPNSIQLDEFVNIIQHPNGGPMEVGLRFNQVVAIEEKRIYYLTDTEEGSSGSPVFDDLWRLVALHHSGGKLDSSGDLTIAANVGVPINLIREKVAVYLNS